MQKPAMKNISVDRILTWLTIGLFRFVFVEEGSNVLITRFGKYRKTLRPGLNSFFSLFGLFGQIHYFYVTDPNTLNVKRTHEVDIKEIVFDFPSEKVISRDNVEFKVDAIVFFKVIEPWKAVFNVNDYVKSLQLTIRSILRDEIGRIDLEEVYCSRATVSRNLEKEADIAVTDWGIDVTQLEIKEFELGDFARELIEQKQGELEKKKAIMKAEALKEAKIEEARAVKACAEMEGESAKVRAQAEAEAARYRAEAEADALRLRAGAEAEAERFKFDAEVYGYQKIAEVLDNYPHLLTEYLQLHNAEKISQNLGEGKATTVFLPSDMQLMLRSLNIFGDNGRDYVDGGNGSDKADKDTDDRV